MPDPVALNRKIVTGQSIAGGGGTFDFQGPNGTNLINTQRRTTLVLLLDMSGAVVGDLSVAVVPYESDMTTPQTGTPIPVVQSSGPTVAAGRVQYFGQYDVFGLEAVRVRVINGNAGAQTMNGSWELMA